MNGLIPEIVYACWCIFFSLVNAKAIKSDNRIYHGINGALHFVIGGYFGYTIHFIIGLAMIFIGRLFFDVSLNLFRGLPIGYVPEKPKSIFDILEKKVFKDNGILPKIIYLVILIILLLIQFLWIGN